MYGGKIAFDKGIEEVKEITNEVVLSDCRFVPIHRSQSLGNGTRTVLKGNLFIEGYIQHNIEYRYLIRKISQPFIPIDCVKI